MMAHFLNLIKARMRPLPSILSLSTLNCITFNVSSSLLFLLNRVGTLYWCCFHAVFLEALSIMLTFDIRALLFVDLLFIYRVNLMDLSSAACCNKNQPSPYTRIKTTRAPPHARRRPVAQQRHQGGDALGVLGVAQLEEHDLQSRAQRVADHVVPAQRRQDHRPVPGHTHPRAVLHAEPAPDEGGVAVRVCVSSLWLHRRGAESADASTTGTSASRRTSSTARSYPTSARSSGFRRSCSSRSCGRSSGSMCAPRREWPARCVY